MSPSMKSFTSLFKNISTINKKISKTNTSSNHDDDEANSNPNDYNSRLLFNTSSNSLSHQHRNPNTTSLDKSSSTQKYQSTIPFPTLIPTQIRNPYPKSKKLPSKKLSIQSKLNSPLLTDDTWIGDRIQPLIKNHARIWIQNVNGLDTSNNFSILYEQLSYIKRYDIHFLSLSESRLNPHNPYISDNIDAAFSFIYPDSKHKLSNTKMDTFSTFQYGGVLSATMNTLSSRVAGLGQDPFGRFNWIDFYGKQNFLRIYTVYRVNHDTDITCGDTSAWSNERTLLRERNIHENPRQNTITALFNKLQEDLRLNRNIVICGDFNENVLNGSLNTKLTELGLINIMQSIIPSHLSDVRTHNRGASVIDGIWCTYHFSTKISAMGLAPFDFLFPSDHRGAYVDFDIRDFLDNMNITLLPAPYRRLKSSIPKRVKEYSMRAISLYEEHKLELKIKQLPEFLTPLSLTDKALLLNKLDKEIHDILTHSERNCCAVSRHCDLMFSNELQKALRSYRQNKNILSKLIRHSQDSSDDSIIHQAKETRKAKCKVKQCSQNHKSLRNAMLDELALDKVQFFPDKNLKKSSVLKQMKNSEQSRDEHSRIRLATHGRLLGGLSYVLIPAKSSYPSSQTSASDFNHYDVQTIWDRTQIDNGNDIDEWERIDDSIQVTTYITHFLKKHFAQSNSTPFTTDEWVEKLSDEKFQNELIEGSVQSQLTLTPAANRILQSFATNDLIQPIPLLPTWNQFTDFILKSNETTSASPSNRHYGHYKALLMSAPSVLRGIFDLLCISLTNGIVLDRWQKTVTTVIPKDGITPKIHRLRPLHIIEVELQFISKNIWSKKLMSSAESHMQITDAQFGGRKNRQAQSSVINTVLTFDYHRQLRKAFSHNNDDLRANFDRELAHFSAAETRKNGLPYKAGEFLIKTTQSQKFFIKTKAGISHDYYTYSSTDKLWGLGQGISWAGVCWQFTATTIDTCLKDTSYTSTFTNPDNTLSTQQFLKFFIDDTTKMCNSPGQLSLLHATQSNMQHHADIVHATGGALALDKCNYYLINYKFDNNMNPVEMKSHENPGTLQIICPTSNQLITIKRLEPNEEHKILGCYICPTNSHVKQKKVLQSFILDWKSQMISSSLPPYLIIKAFKTVLSPKLTYRLSATSFSFDECDALMKPIRPLLLHSCGTHSKFPKAIMQSGSSYGGYNIPHIYDLQGIHKLKFFKFHLTILDKTGRLMLIQLQYLQMEIGISQPFLNSDYDTYAPLATPTWTKQIWEYLHKRDLQIDISRSYLLPKQRDNDMFIMDILFQFFTSTQLCILNKVRLHLKILFLSDICDIRGKILLPEVRNITIFRTSLLQWPYQPILPKWKKLWKEACQYLQHYLSGNPLGEWKTSHQSWNAQVTEGNHFLLHNNKWYSRHPVKPNLYIPATTLPNISSSSLSNADFYTSKSGIVLIASGAPLQPTTYNIQKLTITPDIDELLFGSFSSTNEELIVTRLKTNNGKMCADGSIKNGLGSFAYCFAGAGDTILFQQHSAIHGDNTQLTSTRAELFGILACLRYLNYIGNKYNFDQRYRVLVCADNEPAVNSPRKTHLSVKHIFAPDIDLIYEIKHSMKHSQFHILLKHVKGHQDRVKLYSDLSPLSKINVKMDSFAKQLFNQPQNPVKYQQMCPFLPSGVVSLRDPFHRITTNFNENIPKYAIGTEAEKHLAKSMQIENKFLPFIDWDSLKRFMNSEPSKSKIQTTKILHKQLPTMERQFRFKHSKTNKCPLCSNSIETFSHLFQCQHVPFLQHRNDLIHTLHTQLQELNTCPLLIRHLVCIIRQFSSKFTSKAPSPDASEISSIVSSALHHQINLGIQNMFCGLISFEFSTAQEKHYRTTNSNKSLSGKRWSKTFIRYLFQFTKSLWKKRCEMMNESNEMNVESKLRYDCKSLFFQLKKSNDLPYNYSHLLHKKPTFFSTARPQALNAWMRKITLGLERRQKSALTGTSDIRKWTRRIPPPKSPIPPKSPPRRNMNQHSKDTENWYKKFPRGLRTPRRSPGIDCSTIANLPPVIPQCLLDKEAM